MALVGDPALFLLDEPFTALDDAGRAWLASVLAARRGKSATVLAMHGTEHAQEIADRSLVLENGKWVA